MAIRCFLYCLSKSLFSSAARDEAESELEEAQDEMAERKKKMEEKRGDEPFETTIR